MYTVSKKRGVDVNRFWKFFHCWKQQ